MAYDTSGFNLNLGQEQAIVPSLANLAPYAPNFQGMAWKPANIQAPDVSEAKGIGAALSSIGEGIKVAYKSAQDDKKELRKYAIESAKLAAAENKEAIREARAQQNHADSMAMQAANLAVSQGQLSLAQQKQADKTSGAGNYDEYLTPENVEANATGDRIEGVMQGIKKKETPQYFPESKLELGAPAPPVDESGGLSFDSGNNLGSLTAPVAMPADQRYAALQDIGSSSSPFNVASADGAGMNAPTPDLPYSLQGGVPKPLADVQVPSTRELYSSSGFTPTPIPTYGTTTQETPAVAATQPSRSPIVAFPIADPKGGVLGYAYYDRASRKLIPGSYVAETKASNISPAGFQVPEGQVLKGMTISSEGKPSYTYGLEKEGKAEAPLLQDQMKILTNIEGANSTLNNIETKLKEIGSSTGPIVGTARGYNPYDVVAQSVENMVNSLVPGLARGVFGEVGVLTDSDVKRYKALIPNMRTDPKVAQQIMKDLREKLNSTKKANLGVWEKAGYNTKGFQETEPPAKNELQKLVKEIDSAKDQNSPEILAKKKRATELYLLQRK